MSCKGAYRIMHESQNVQLTHACARHNFAMHIILYKYTLILLMLVVYLLVCYSLVRSLRYVAIFIVSSLCGCVWGGEGERCAWGGGGGDGACGRRSA